MDIFQLENLYKVNGLTDFKLKNTDDLLKCHGVDYKNIEGYNRLDDIHREIYKRFIIKLFNHQGMESRITLYPKGIYFVEEIDYIVIEKNNDGEDYRLGIGGIVFAINKNGLKSVLREWRDEDYQNVEFQEGKPYRYLRFEFEHQGRSEWLHVIKDGMEWY